MTANLSTDADFARFAAARKASVETDHRVASNDGRTIVCTCGDVFDGPGLWFSMDFASHAKAANQYELCQARLCDCSAVVRESERTNEDSGHYDRMSTVSPF